MDLFGDSRPVTRKVFNDPTFSKDLSEHGQIIRVEFSPYDWSQSALLVAFENKIILASVNISDDFVFDIVSEFPHPYRCTSISFSPDTICNSIQKNLLFCTAGNDFKLRIFKNNVDEENTCLVLSGHTSYVNDVKFDPNNVYLASVSDDQTVKLWDTEEFKCSATLHLTSAGISVCWNKDDNSKLLVAERMGIIRFYNVDTRCPILSLDYGTMLASCHWAPSDCQLVASLQLGELFIWDLTKPCQPIHKNLVFPEAGGEIRFSPLGELIAAVNNLDGVLKVVSVQNQQTKFATSVTIPSNISWHSRFPVLCIGDNNRLCFWKVTAK